VHLIHEDGGQSYDVTIEVWNAENDANTESRTNPTNAFFAMVEHPQTGEFISITCWNDDVGDDCQDVYDTIHFE
jgi:hypothetical protein